MLVLFKEALFVLFVLFVLLEDADNRQSHEDLQVVVAGAPCESQQRAGPGCAPTWYILADVSWCNRYIDRGERWREIIG